MNTNPQVFADAAIKAYQDKPSFIRYQENGFNILEKQYEKNYWQKKLISRLISQHKNLDTNRKDNFFGLMLRHHSMKSTQYMSQWIEAKNKL